MGLYINKNKYPAVYKNKDKIPDPNQKIVRKDYLTEFIDEQQQANVSLNKAINSIKQQFLNQEVVQANHWDKIITQLNELNTSNQKQKEYEELIIHLLKTQEELQKQLTEKFNNQEEFQTGVLNRLDQQEAFARRLCIARKPFLGGSLA